MTIDIRRCLECGATGRRFVRFMEPPICVVCYDREGQSIDDRAAQGVGSGLAMCAEHAPGTDVKRLGSGSYFCRKLTEKMTELGYFSDMPENPNDYLWGTAASKNFEKEKPAKE